MLDTFFKKYAWTANLALIFAAAWLCARTVNTVIGTAVRPRPAVDLAALPAAPPRPAARAPLESDKLFPLIGQQPPPPAEDEGPVEAKQVKPQNCHDREATPSKSGLRAQVVAAVVADDARASLASITEPGAPGARVFGVGDRLQGGPVILSIERLRDPKDATGVGFKVAAIICNDGRKEYLDDEPDEGAPAAPPPVAGAGPAHFAGPEAPPSSSGVGDSVRKVNASTYEVKKKYIEDTLSNLSSVATQARIVPSFKNGVANGFKLFSIQPGSLYSAIGVENGDVIQRINGYEINSPDKALEVYQKLRESSRITIEIERNGQIVRKEYNVTGS